jgi:hypothetical protein
MKEIIESLPCSEDTKILIAVILLVVIGSCIIFRKHIINFLKKK